jgi:hypothetical protein
MKLRYAEEIPRAAEFMDQSPLGVVAATLIRWPSNSIEEEPAAIWTAF